MSTSWEAPQSTSSRHRPAGPRVCRLGLSGYNGNRLRGTLTCATAGPASSSAAAARPGRPSAQAPAAIPPIPPALQADLDAARRSWLEHCVSSPLVDAATNSRVHLCGVVHYAPHGGPSGLQELTRLVERIQPSILAIEQPFDLAAQAGLPYPQVIQELSALLPAGAQLLAGPDSDASGDTTCHGGAPRRFPWETAAAAAAADLQAAAVQSESARLAALLPGLAVPARLGRDLLDPWEVLGLYGGAEFVMRPGQAAEALRLFGWLPGLEYAALGARAQELGVQVYSVDAPLRLQEKWVAQLLAEFTLREGDLARRLGRDLAEAQALLPPAYGEWDAEVAVAVRGMEAAAALAAEHAQAQGQEEGRQGEAPAQGPDSVSREREREPSQRVLTAFKVSRAVAAAAVPYGAARDAFARQAALQPLKFGLFARRARHLVLQVRDLCQRMSVRQVRVDAGNLNGNAGTSDHRPSGSGDPQQAASMLDVTGQPEQVVLAVVGRQYVPYIEEMWANDRSKLWQGEVPRTFAPSKLSR